MLFDLSSVLTIGYIFVFGAVTMGGLYWARRQRKTRWPFKDSDKLLRSPGESLKRQLTKLDESLVFAFVGGIVAGLLSFGVAVSVVRGLGLKGWSALFVLAAGPLLAVTVGSRRITNLWRRRASLFLGWYGERFTADKLQPLSTQGYRLFHDVPGEPGKKGFNLDHVTVGPSGVAVVETKTRRKGNARSGSKDHEVVFDGKQLIWPWGEDRQGIDQAINGADWLAKWLFERTGMNVAMKPILTFPGWYVRESFNPSIRVVNSKFLPDAVRGRGPAVLTPEQIDLIARQLDERCRDVED